MSEGERERERERALLNTPVTYFEHTGHLSTIVLMQNRGGTLQQFRKKDKNARKQTYVEYHTSVKGR